MITVPVPYSPHSRTHGVRCGCGYLNNYVLHRALLMQGAQRSCGNCGQLFLVKGVEQATDQSVVERRGNEPQ